MGNEMVDSYSFRCDGKILQLIRYILKSHSLKYKFLEGTLKDLVYVVCCSSTTCKYLEPSRYQ